MNRTPRLNALLVCADERDASQRFPRLPAEELRLVTVRHAAEAVRAVLDAPADSPFDVAFLDLREVSEAVALAAELRKARPALEVVVLGRDGTVASISEALRAGAMDFLQRPPSVLQVRVVLERARLARAQRRGEGFPAAAPAGPGGVDALVGVSPDIERVRDLVRRVAPEDVTVLVRGESGTGKELVARAIHALSRRAGRAFVTVDCGSIARNLVESELFGHEKGAFTGAVARKDGLFLRADAGTLFLDEIGEIPLELQPALLRAIDEKRFRPVGGTQLVSSDARIISATNRDLERAVEAGAFRLDLYYRLNVVQIMLPPLRRRRDDIEVLAEHFVKGFSGDRRHRQVRGISRDAMLELLKYDWPGNVRELENVMEQAVTLGRHEEVEVEDLPPRVRGLGVEAARPAAGAPVSLARPLEELEKEAILEALGTARGDTRAVSQMLAIDRSTLYRKMRRFGIDVGQFKR